MPEPFELSDDQPTGGSSPAHTWTPAERERIETLMSRRLEPDEHARLEKRLLARIQEHRSRLEQMAASMNSHWGCEDLFYRYYHGSFKVYRAQDATLQAVALLRQILPERELNPFFEDIIREGTGKEFLMEHNREWPRHTRPMLEAFTHARFMIEMAARYANLPELPQPMPSGWAALLYLYDLR